MNVAIRSSRDEDITEIAAIYRHHVLHGVASFEDIPPDEDEVARRRRAILALKLPYVAPSDRDGWSDTATLHDIVHGRSIGSPSKIRFTSTLLKSVAASAEPCSRPSSSAVANSAIGRWLP